MALSTLVIIILIVSLFCALMALTIWSAFGPKAPELLDPFASEKD